MQKLFLDIYTIIDEMMNSTYFQSRKKKKKYRSVCVNTPSSPSILTTISKRDKGKPR